MKERQGDLASMLYQPRDLTLIMDVMMEQMFNKRDNGECLDKAVDVKDKHNVRPS